MKRMRRFTYLTATGILSILLTIACSSNNQPQDPGKCILPTLDPEVLVTDIFYGLLTWDNKALFNNCWGMNLLPDPELTCSMVCYDPAADICGWRWSWPREAITDLKGYPCLIVGDKPYIPAGYDPSTDSRFPLHLPHIQTLWVEGDFCVSGSGGFNFSFDLAFLDGPVSWPEAVCGEIMVWLSASQSCGADWEGEYVIDGHSYDFYINTTWDPAAPYLAFVLKDTAPPQRLPMHEFIQIGMDQDYVDPDSYLAMVELGAEIWWGEGVATVRNYKVSLNGD